VLKNRFGIFLLDKMYHIKNNFFNDDREYFVSEIGGLFDEFM